MIQHECQLFIQYKSLNIININDIKTFYYYDISIHNMSENLEETTFQNEIININGVNVNIINIDTIDSEWGSMDNFISWALSLTEEDILKLKDFYLQ